MKLYMLSMLALVLLCGCQANTQDVTYAFALPAELQNYKVITLSSGSGTLLYVLVNKTNENRSVIGTSHPWGKGTTHTIVIDGETYIKQ